MKKIVVMIWLVVAQGACSDNEAANDVGDSSVETSDTLEMDVLSDVEIPDVDPWVEDLGDAEDQADSVEDATEELPLEDVQEDVQEPVNDIPEPDVEPSFSNCSEPGGHVNIYDIRDPQCPDYFSPVPTSSPGVYVFFQGVVVSAVYSDMFFVQEMNGGPYSGVSVFANEIFTGDYKPGDRVDIEGYFYEFFDSAQIYLEGISKVSEGTPPEPYVALHPSHFATDGPLAEMFEGVLVQVQDVGTIHTKPDCPNDYGEFLVTGDLRIDDMGVLWDARLGDSFSSITGALHYTFSNTKLEPRDMADIAWLGKGSAGSISKCIEGDCQVPAEVPGTQEVVINEVMADPSLQDTGQEWIELYNPSNQSVDIYGWELRDCGDQVWKLTGPNLVMAPGSYLVLGMNSNTNTNGGLNVDLAYGDGFYLPNTVGSVLLFKGPGPGAQLVDQTRYMAFDPWNQFSTGHSLERIIPVSDGTVSESWSKGSQPYGNGENYGTPGKKNSATP